MGPLQERDVIEVVVAESASEWYIVQRRQELVIKESFSSVAANTTTAVAQVNDLNPPKSEIIHLTGVGVRNGEDTQHELQVKLKNPAAVTVFGTSKLPEGGFLTADLSPVRSPLPLDQFIVYERQPAVVFVNNDLLFAQVPILYFEGFRYLVRPLQGGPLEKESEVGRYLYNKELVRRPKLDGQGVPIIDPQSGRQVQEEVTRYVPSGRAYSTVSIGGFRS